MEKVQFLYHEKLDIIIERIILCKCRNQKVTMFLWKFLNVSTWKAIVTVIIYKGQKKKNIPISKSFKSTNSKPHKYKLNLVKMSSLHAESDQTSKVDGRKDYVRSLCHMGLSTLFCNLPFIDGW